MNVSRRALLVGGCAGALAGAFALLLDGQRRRSASANGSALGRRERSSLLELPPGFDSRVIDRCGDAMSDGYKVPGSPDGMGCAMTPDGKLVLMRNHELDVDLSRAASAGMPREAYDARCLGGVSRVVLEPRNLSRVSSNMVLTGTLRNCGGGLSPWGWLSAEEAVEAGHGYVFRCPVDAAALLPADRLTAYGRFNHEAVYVDPRSNVAYLTEDQADGCLYRFVPHRPDEPFVGKLQALRVDGKPRLDTANLEIGVRMRVAWVDVPEPDPSTDSVRYQAQDRGAAIFRRAEGIAGAGDAVHICATIGGRKGLGQILLLSLAGDETLQAVGESSGPSDLEMPDNICLAKNGDIYMAEDGLDGAQYVRGITPDGRVFDVARLANGSGELAGVCFSPGGQHLFVNVYEQGVTLAVTGPFRELGRTARAT